MLLPTNTLLKKKKKDDSHVPEWKYVQGIELAQI